jgi:3,5-epimerase/4-reductase
MPISDDANPRDFITKILGYKKITSLPNSMTVISDILPVLLALTHDGKFGGRVNACNKSWFVTSFFSQSFIEMKIICII